MEADSYEVGAAFLAGARGARLCVQSFHLCYKASLRGTFSQECTDAHWQCGESRKGLVCMFSKMQVALPSVHCIGRYFVNYASPAFSNLVVDSSSALPCLF